MSLHIEDNRIIVKDNLGNITFDTNRRMLHITHVINKDFIVPAARAAPSGGSQIYIYSNWGGVRPDFVIGRITNLDGVDRYPDEGSGSFISYIAGAPHIKTIRLLTPMFYDYGLNRDLIVLEQRTSGVLPYPEQKFNGIFYCGSYDL